MPAQSRAQRRRANTRQQPRSASKPSTLPKTYPAPVQEAANVLPETTVEPATNVLAAPVVTAAAPNSRVARRLRTRSASEPVDYTKDYRDAAKDLRLIAIWSVLLLVIMLALYFARTNGMLTF